MNCKQGDLAVIVKSVAGNIGKIVNCMELDLAHRLLLKSGEIIVAPCWRVDRHFPTFDGTPGLWIRDSSLRPIRDPGDDAQDESLSWKKVPNTDKREELA